MMQRILDGLNAFMARARVVLTAAPTYLILASTVVTILAEEVAPLLPEGMSDQLTVVVVRVLGVLAAAIAVIRRVTPVVPDERGLLPVEQA